MSSLTNPATLRALVGRMRDGLYVTDSEGTFLDGNEALLSLVGVGSVEELATHSLRDLLVGADARFASLARLEREGDVHESRLELRRPDGGSRTVLDIAMLLHDPSSGAALHQGIMVDVTPGAGSGGRVGQPAARDPLTGCFDRGYLPELERRMAELGVTTWGCLHLEVEGMGTGDDAPGTVRGDALLTRMARFLFRQLRAEESVLRVGDADFAVVLAAADGRQTENVARRLQLTAMRAAPAAFAIGWASRHPGEPLEHTLTRAAHELLRVHVVPRAPEHDLREG